VLNCAIQMDAYFTLRSLQPRRQCSVRFSPAFVCLSVCLSGCLRDISKTAAARITKLVVEMFHHETWKPIYFGVKRSKVKGTVFALL